MTLEYAPTPSFSNCGEARISLVRESIVPDLSLFLVSGFEDWGFEFRYFLLASPFNLRFSIHRAIGEPGSFKTLSSILGRTL